MRETRDLMGMPVSVDVAGGAEARLIGAVYDYLEAVDRRFSTYKPDSEISAINRGDVETGEASAEMREVFALGERTRRETDGFFDMRRPDGTIDPSGIVKGWAILNAARLIEAQGVGDYYVDAGGDIQSGGHNPEGGPWSVGIRNPFNPDEIVKVVYPRGRGIATSGTYVRGQHVYDPHNPGAELTDVVSLTVIGPDVLEADRFATAAFAMGREGIYFIEQLEGFEAYAIDRAGIATLTTGFTAYTAP